MTETRKRSVYDLSPRQAQVLGLVETWFGGDMPATSENYKRIATEIGWKNPAGSAVCECLYVARGKGFVRSEGGTSARPERWVIVRDKPAYTGPVRRSAPATPEREIAATNRQHRSARAQRMRDLWQKGLSVSQIAARLGVKPAAVYPHIADLRTEGEIRQTYASHG